MRSALIPATAVLMTALLASACQTTGPLESVADRRGQRFPDLVFQDPEGRARKLSDYRGRVVVVHFWASWCSSCRSEKWQFQKLYDQLEHDPDIVIITLNVKEAYQTGKRWAEAAGLTLPLFDSRYFRRDYLPVAGGGSYRVDGIPDTVVLDGDGIVVDAANGRRRYWEYYANALRAFVTHPPSHAARTARAGG